MFVWRIKALAHGLPSNYTDKGESIVQGKHIWLICISEVSFNNNSFNKAVKIKLINFWVVRLSSICNWSLNACCSRQAWIMIVWWGRRHDKVHGNTFIMGISNKRLAQTDSQKCHLVSTICDVWVILPAVPVCYIQSFTFYVMRTLFTFIQGDR